jgi:hypothetical protein
MIATTIIISTRVKPALREVLFVFMFYSLVSLRGVNDATGGFHLLLQSSFTDCLLQPQLWSSLSTPGAKVQQAEFNAFFPRPLLLNGREFEADTMLAGPQRHLKCPNLGHHVEFSDTSAEERISSHRVDSRLWSVMTHSDIGRVGLGRTQMRWVADASRLTDYVIMTGDGCPGTMERYAPRSCRSGQRVSGNASYATRR